MQTTAPHFTITSIDRTSITLAPGQTFTINVTIENNGNADGTVVARLKDHNDNIVDAKTQTIPVGGQTVIALSGTAPSTQGTYTWTIEAYNQDTSTLDDTDTITITVQAQQQQKKDNTLLYLIVGLILLVLLASRRKR